MSGELPLAQAQEIEPPSFVGVRCSAARKIDACTSGPSKWTLILPQPKKNLPSSPKQYGQTTTAATYLPEMSYGSATPISSLQLPVLPYEQPPGPSPGLGHLPFVV
jgi:hypothetical protein